MMKPMPQQDKIDLSSSMTLVEQVAAFIMNDIRKASPGDKILPERALAEKYGVSRQTIKGAVASLTAQGLLARRVGKGTFVSDKIKSHSDLPVSLLIYTDDFPHQLMSEIINNINQRQELVIPAFFYGDYRVFDLYEEAVKGTVEANRKLDLISLDEGIMPILAEEGVLTPLNELLDNSTRLSAELFHPNVLKAFTYKDKIYGIPQTFTTYALFYNRDIFKEHKLDFPNNSWRWDDLVSAAEKLTVTDPETGSNRSFGLGGPNFNQNIFATILQQNIPADIDLSSINIFECPETIEAIEWFNNINRRNLSPPVQNGMFMTPAKMFSTGSIAMFIGIYADYLELAAHCDYDFGIVELPGQQRQATAIPVQGWGICSHSNSKRKSFQVIEQLLSKPNANKIADQTRRISAIYGKQNRTIPAVFINSLRFAVSSSTLIAPNIAAKKSYKEELCLLLNNFRTPQEFCAGLAKFRYEK